MSDKQFLLQPSECNSTHGGAGYAPGTVWESNDAICGWCGTRIKNAPRFGNWHLPIEPPEPLLRRVLRWLGNTRG
jgi:hypothetical protein